MTTILQVCRFSDGQALLLALAEKIEKEHGHYNNPEAVSLGRLAYIASQLSSGTAENKKWAREELKKMIGRGHTLHRIKELQARASTPQQSRKCARCGDADQASSNTFCNTCGSELPSPQQSQSVCGNPAFTEPCTNPNEAGRTAP